jgi:uncharacterized protein YndB with AHSA1/START domain
MAEATSSSATGQARPELMLTRILGAPRSLVFRAWTGPKHMAPFSMGAPRRKWSCVVGGSDGRGARIRGGKTRGDRRWKTDSRAPR